MTKVIQVLKIHMYTHACIYYCKSDLIVFFVEEKHNKQAYLHNLLAIIDLDMLSLQDCTMALDTVPYSEVCNRHFLKSFLTKPA